MGKKISFLLLVIFSMTIGCAKSPTSPSSGNWELVTNHAFSNGRYGLTGTVFNGQMWAVGGASGPVTTYYSDVYSSGDGANWTQTTGSAPFGGRYGSQLLSFGGKLWLIGGNNSGYFKNDVWNSIDGINWTLVLAPTTLGTGTQFSPREDFGALVYNGLMWVIGGFDGQSRNDVWCSPDGITWTKVLGSTASGGANQFAGRFGFGTAIFNNEMWVFDGANALSSNSDPVFGYADSWYSTNGNTWTLATSNGNYGRLYFTQAVSFNNLLWIPAGYLWNNWGGQSGVATSSNGIQWNDVVGSFPPRFYHLSLAYNGYIWVIAGADDYCASTQACPVIYLNDVWRTH